VTQNVRVSRSVIKAAASRDTDVGYLEDPAQWLKHVPVKDVIFLPAGRAERAYSATKQQSRPHGDEDSGQIRLDLGEPVSDDGKICS
jgi:hypothetical protein